MEPRIAARRTDVRARRRLRIWILLGVVGLLVALAWGFTQSPFLDVDEVVVIGAQRTGSQNVLDAAGIEVGTPLLGLDLDGPRRSVAALPWVHRVRSNRTWGGKITLDVVEREAVAQAYTGDFWVLVDVKGRVLQEGNRQQKLPVVQVASVPEPGGWLASSAAPLLEVSEALMPLAGRHSLGAISWQNAQVVVGLEGDRQALWGSADSSQAKAVALATFLEKVDSDCYEQIDLGVPDFPVLTSSGLCP
ncbi:MAG: FtsQ-type POTRA domain-containing protein [bacterium]|nr:FtsQ-type POTRA domain-containing protein [bacterium]MCY4256929.1 FtsQ-type POTRA domain-containing protein [bacterium]